LILGALAIALIATILGGSFVSPDTGFQVRSGHIIHRFSAQGRVECQQTVDVVPEVSGVVLEIAVDEGDAVKKGQLLARLDNRTLQASLAEAESVAAAALAHWEELKVGTRPEDIEAAEAQVLVLEGQWEAAQAREQEVLRGPRQQEIDNAKQLLEAAKAEKVTADRQHQRGLALKKSNTITPAELDELELRANSAASAVLARQSQWDLLTTGASDEEKAQVKAQVKSALGRLDQARAELKRLRNGATVETLAAAEAEHRRTRDAVERARVQLSHAEIYSPSDGIVLRRFHHPGELVHPQITQPLRVLGDGNDRELRVEVMEGDVYKVKPDQIVSITSDAYIGKRWKGRIARLSPVMGRKRLLSEHPREKTDVKVLEAWIRPDEPMNLPINAPVEVTAQIVVGSNVPVIPRRCLLPPDQTVRMIDGTIREVELGEGDDGFVEITAGLDVGERVHVPK
jgi:HlyD family secretion protein